MRIKELTNTIRKYSECELDYGTLKTLKMIDDEAERMEKQIKEIKSE